MPTDAFTDDELLAMCALADLIAAAPRRSECEERFLEALRRVGLWGREE